MILPSSLGKSVRFAFAFKFSLDRILQFWYEQLGNLFVNSRCIELSTREHNFQVRYKSRRMIFPFWCGWVAFSFFFHCYQIHCHIQRLGLLGTCIVRSCSLVSFIISLCTKHNTLMQLPRFRQLVPRPLTKSTIIHEYDAGCTLDNTIFLVCT